MSENTGAKRSKAIKGSKKKGSGAVFELSASEHKKIVSQIKIAQKDLQKFKSLLEKGALKSASTHDTAVQGNVGLSAENVVRLSKSKNKS